jgi:adhesin/invasin
MKRRAISALLVAALTIPALSCDKATPVAPDGTILTISANPTQIPLNGTSTITVIGRKPDGQPLNPGTEVRFSVDRGTVTPAVATIDNGVATTTFRADGRQGAVMITAATGGTMTMAMTALQVGESAETKPTLIVNVNPDTLSTGGTSTVTITARNADGSPVGAGQEVTLTSTLGSLSPARPRTNANGIATSTFTAGTQPGMVTIRAVLGSSDAQTAMVNILGNLLTLSASPTTVVRGETTMISLSALVTTSTTGAPVSGVRVTFQSSRGVFGSTGSGIITVTTDANGQARATLTVRPSDISSTTVTEFVITATAPSGGATQLEDTVSITVTGSGSG